MTHIYPPIHPVLGKNRRWGVVEGFVGRFKALKILTFLMEEVGFDSLPGWDPRGSHDERTETCNLTPPPPLPSTLSLPAAQFGSLACLTQFGRHHIWTCYTRYTQK